MIVYDKEQKEIVIPNGLGNVNIIINGGGDCPECPECPELTEISITENGRYEGAYNVVNVDVPTEGGDKPTPPQDGWGMTGVFNNWGETPDIPFNEDGEWEGRPYKVIRNFEATGGEFKIRRNNDSTDSYTANFYDIPQLALLRKDDWNMSIDDGLWDIYIFFGNDGVPNEMLILHNGTDLSTIKYEYTLNVTIDKENAIINIGDGYTDMTDTYYGSATVPMKYGCSYSISIHMEGYEDIYEELSCRNDEERTYTLTKIEGYGCNFISPIVFSKNAGNIINAERVQIPTFVYEGNQYYNVDKFNLADIEEFKIQILFKPNNSGDSEPINIFGCENPELDSPPFGARINRGEIEFQIDRDTATVPYNENAWYNVEMGYNTTKKWVIVNGETLFEQEDTEITKPSQTLMIGAINKGGNALSPFYGKIAATYIKSNANQVWLLPKENGTMAFYWNNLNNSDKSISGNNNARFEIDNISGDGMKSITWLGNFEDKWVTPSMNDRDGNGFIVVSPSEGYSGLKRTVINPQTIYNEGLEAGKAEGGEGGSCNLGVLDWTLTNPNAEQKNASDDGYDGYSSVVVRPENVIAQEKENAVNDFKNKMQEITITKNGTYSIDDAELTRSIAFDGNSYFNTGIVPTENIKIEVCIKITNGNDSGAGGIIIGGGIDSVNNDTKNRGIAIGMGGGAIYGIWGAIKSWNNPYKYEGEGTTTVVLQKTNDSWGWDSEKGSFGASTLYIGGYNRNGEEAEEKFLQSIVYIKIWTDRNDESTLITYTPKTNGNFDANGAELQKLGEGTATFVEENVNKYPYGFKRVEVNVVPQISVEEEGLNVWYNHLKKIIDENDTINYNFEETLLGKKGDTMQNVFPGITSTISGQAVAKPFFIYRTDKTENKTTKIGKLVSGQNGTPVTCSVVTIGAFDCKNIQTVDSEAFKYMTDLCYIYGMNNLGKSFTSPQTIDFTYCTNLFIKADNKKVITNFAESLFNLSTGNKNSINTSTLKFKSAVQERSENADAIALMQSKGWTVEFV